MFLTKEYSLEYSNLDAFIISGNLKGSIVMHIVSYKITLSKPSHTGRKIYRNNFYVKNNLLLLLLCLRPRSTFLSISNQIPSVMQLYLLVPFVTFCKTISFNPKELFMACPTTI